MGGEKVVLVLHLGLSWRCAHRAFGHILDYSYFVIAFGLGRQPLIDVGFWAGARIGDVVSGQDRDLHIGA